MAVVRVGGGVGARLPASRRSERAAAGHLPPEPLGVVRSSTWPCLVNLLDNSAALCQQVARCDSPIFGSIHATRPQSFLSIARDGAPLPPDVEPICSSRFLDPQPRGTRAGPSYFAASCGLALRPRAYRYRLRNRWRHTAQRLSSSTCGPGRLIARRSRYYPTLHDHCLRISACLRRRPTRPAHRCTSFAAAARGYDHRTAGTVRCALHLKRPHLQRVITELRLPDGFRPGHPARLEEGPPARETIRESRPTVRP